MSWGRRGGNAAEGPHGGWWPLPAEWPGRLAPLVLGLGALPGASQPSPSRLLPVPTSRLRVLNGRCCPSNWLVATDSSLSFSEQARTSRVEG